MWIIEIPYVLLNILYLIPMTVNVCLMMNRIYVELANGGGLIECSGSFYIGMGTISTIAIYASFAMSSNLIISLVEQLENTVHIRMKFQFIFLNKKKCFLSLILCV